MCSSRSSSALLRLAVSLNRRHRKPNPSSPRRPVDNETRSTTTEHEPTGTSFDYGTVPGFPERFQADRGSPQHLDYLQACMAEQGFEVTVNYEDQSITGTDAGQEEAYDNAIVVCRQAAVDAGLDAAPAPYTDEELELIYDAYLVIGACLEEHGFSTPPAPSREAFLDGQTNPWHPYGALATARFHSLCRGGLPAGHPADHRGTTAGAAGQVAGPALR